MAYGSTAFLSFSHSVWEIHRDGMEQDKMLMSFAHVSQVREDRQILVSRQEADHQESLHVRLA
jgi:hypothetical protein